MTLKSKKCVYQEQSNLITSYPYCCGLHVEVKLSLCAVEPEVKGQRSVCTHTENLCLIDPPSPSSSSAAAWTSLRSPPVELALTRDSTRKRKHSREVATAEQPSRDRLWGRRSAQSLKRPETAPEYVFTESCRKCIMNKHIKNRSVLLITDKYQTTVRTLNKHFYWLKTLHTNSLWPF